MSKIKYMYFYIVFQYHIFNVKKNIYKLLLFIVEIFIDKCIYYKCRIYEYISYVNMFYKLVSSSKKRKLLIILIWLNNIIIIRHLFAI